MMKHLTRSRGAAAALLLTSIAPTLGAQVVEPARARRQDSVFVRMFTMPGIPMDSLKVLVHSLQREAYGSSDWLAITRQLDSLLLAQRELMARGFAMRRLAPSAAFAPSGWLGFVTQGPSQQNFDGTGQHVVYFAYPLILSVDPNSPAERAGIAPGDTLLAYNGVDVVNHDFNVTELLQPERRISITVRRDGAKKDYAVRVARGPARIVVRRQDLDAGMPVAVRAPEPDMPEGARMAVPTLAPQPMPARPKMPWAAPSIAPNGMFGASLSVVSAAMAKALNLRVGVLANEVPEESPAWRDGLRPGDVIVSVEDVPVRSVSEFRELVMTHLPQHSVAVHVVRSQKPRVVRLTWPSP